MGQQNLPGYLRSQLVCMWIGKWKQRTSNHINYWDDGEWKTSNSIAIIVVVLHDSRDAKGVSLWKSIDLIKGNEKYIWRNSTSIEKNTEIILDCRHVGDSHWFYGICWRVIVIAFGMMFCALSSIFLMQMVWLIRQFIFINHACKYTFLFWFLFF